MNEHSVNCFDDELSLHWSVVDDMIPDYAAQSTSSAPSPTQLQKSFEDTNNSPPIWHTHQSSVPQSFQNTTDFYHQQLPCQTLESWYQSMELPKIDDNTIPPQQLSSESYNNYSDLNKWSGDSYSLMQNNNTTSLYSSAEPMSHMYQSKWAQSFQNMDSIPQQALSHQPFQPCHGSNAQSCPNDIITLQQLSSETSDTRYPTLSNGGHTLIQSSCTNWACSLGEVVPIDNNDKEFQQSEDICYVCVSCGIEFESNMDRYHHNHTIHGNEEPLLFMMQYDN